MQVEVLHLAAILYNINQIQGRKMNDVVAVKSEFSVDFSYSVCFTRDAFGAGNTALRSVLAPGAVNRIVVFIESGIAEIYPELQAAVCDWSAANCDIAELRCAPFILSGGELSKTPEFALEVCGLLEKASLCRQSYALIIGGGAFLDSVSFACSLYHRGIRQIRFPTTALAQCDSGVGVKNAVNFLDRKNLIGVFDPPEAVITDSRFLDRLPLREISSGAAEALKVALIKDADFFAQLERDAERIMHSDMDAVSSFIRRSAEIHLEHIAKNGDPFELGSARPLDFGHWSAHKLEMLSGYTLRHGEAVGMGILLDTRYAVLSGIAAESVYERTESLFRRLGLPFEARYFEMRHADGRRKIFDGVEEFREHLGGGLHITLPVSTGRRVEVTSIDFDLMERALRDVVSRAGTAE